MNGSRCTNGSTSRGGSSSGRSFRTDRRLAVGPWWSAAQVRKPGVRGASRRRRALGSWTIGRKPWSGSRGGDCTKATFAIGGQHGRGLPRGGLRSCACSANPRGGYGLLGNSGCVARWKMLRVVCADIRGSTLCPAIRVEAACRRDRG